MGLKSKPLDQVRKDVPVHHVTKEDLVRVNLDVPSSVRQAWKIAAVNESKSLSSLIIEAMSIHLNTQVNK